MSQVSKSCAKQCWIKNIGCSKIWMPNFNEKSKYTFRDIKILRFDSLLIAKVQKINYQNKTYDLLKDSKQIVNLFPDETIFLIKNIKLIDIIIGPPNNKSSQFLFTKNFINWIRIQLYKRVCFSAIYNVWRDNVRSWLIRNLQTKYQSQMLTDTITLCMNVLPTLKFFESKLKPFFMIFTLYVNVYKYILSIHIVAAEYKHIHIVS